MADQPGGRARGRARGRGRAKAAQQQVVRPGSGPPAAAAAAAAQEDVLPTPGRGRSRGGSAQPPAQPIPQQQAAGEPPADQMAKLAIQQSSEGVGGISSRQRRTDVRYGDPKTRPAHIVDKTGGSGTRVFLRTNTFRLKTKPDWHLYQYHVEFNPPCDSKRLRQFLVRSQSENHFGKALAFDGMVLFLVRRLPERVTKILSRKKDGTDVELTVTLTNELPPNSPICLQVYNIIFRKVLSMIGMEQVGRHYYNPNKPATIPQHHLMLWPGFITSILQYEKDVMLMADVSHKILRSDTVVDILYELLKTKGRGRFKEEATRALVGEIVLTEYNNKTYRVDDINWDMNPKSTFKKFDGTEISFVEYYKTNYEKNIEDMDQPLLISRPKKREERQAAARGQELGPVMLIPELCMLTGLSDETRANFHVMKDIATHTRISPDKRIQTMMEFNRDFAKPEVREYTETWGLRFDDKLHQFEGRTLPSEKIKQKDRGGKQYVQYTYKPADAEWSREMRGYQLLTSVDLNEWAVLYTQRDTPKAQDFVQTMMKVAPAMGMKVKDPATCCLGDDRAETYLQTIRGGVQPTTQMVVCILPTNRKDRYDAIKKCCCLEHPVPSQVILGRTLSKKPTLMSVATKIAMQINCKLGGELWALEIPLKSTMIIGIDNYHDSSTKGRSVCGVVCSMNKDFTRYYSDCTFQHTGQELIDGLRPILLAALKKFYEINGALPDKVIVYRDGVGDGQLPAVVEHELPQMLEMLKAIGPDYNPKVAVVVVKKRINNRFFYAPNPNANTHANPPPGTIIDKDVTKPDLYDFFLVSQSVRQGTVTPTHYNVIWDTSGLKLDHIQRLTYQLCHLYYNGRGTIRVPAPCLYAHKLAFLVGQSLHKQPSRDLSDRLFFL
ncbi:piwi-like protein 1 [Amphiura filiformis]|uniref:piwi-like protein 1 n=1 Tax=Amphiura filiformis TaxID=82378 RepID=UPI003B21D034